jgi:hypothetical protein
MQLTIAEDRWYFGISAFHDYHINSTTINYWLRSAVREEVSAFLMIYGRYITFET